MLGVLPSILNKEVRDVYYSKIVSKVHKDLDKITVLDLLKFQPRLETVIMDISKGTCLLAQIEEDCTEISNISCTAINFMFLIIILHS